MHNLERLSILLVEDNPGDRRLAEIALREGADDAHIRCDLQAVGTLAEGLSRLADSANHFDAVILDLGLPDAKGLGGLQATRVSAHDVPIIVLTGLSDLSAATEALKFGASDYLDKAEMQPRPLLRSIRYAIERKKSESELTRLAQTDPLTGLLNRRAFFDELERARLHARRSGLACAVMVLDADDLKEVNDLFGHDTGDEFLVAVGQVLRSQLRETDSVARIGGDEFAVLATHLQSADVAIDIAEKIAAGIKKISHVNGKNLVGSVSIGITMFPMDDCDANQLTSHADMAMYKAKAGKKGSIVFFDNEMDANVKARHVLKRRMPEDITNGRFQLHFQPIVNAQTHTIVAMEGLARWQDREGRMISPAVFIPLAEESDLISKLSSRLLEEACAFLRRWSDAGLPAIPVSLNISPVQCRDPAFGLKLIATIEKFGMPPRLINIEITESSIIRDLERTTQSLRLLKSLGIGIHMDDFGTGYSSLSLLKKLPFDALKIDRSFIIDLGAESGSESVVHAIVELARKFGFKTIAEGVETEAQARILAHIGTDCLQGYYFSPPLDAERFASLMSQRKPLPATTGAPAPMAFAS